MNIKKTPVYLIIVTIFIIMPVFVIADTLVSDVKLSVEPFIESYTIEKNDIGDNLTDVFASHFVPTQLKKLLKNTNRIVLTFDDGPHPRATPDILRILKKYDIKALFFVLGLQAEKYPELVKMIYEDGHMIGNHTYSHKRLTDLSEEQARAEITKTDRLIESITGEKPIFLRPPYGIGTKSKVIQKIAKEENLRFFLWTVDSKDWKSKNANAILTSIERQLGLAGKNKVGGAILLHDIYTTTACAVESIIKSSLSAGYNIISPSEINMSDKEIASARALNNYKSFDPELSGNKLLVTLLTKEKKELRILDIIKAYRRGNLMLLLAMNK